MPPSINMMATKYRIKEIVLIMLTSDVKLADFFPIRVPKSC